MKILSETSRKEKTKEALRKSLIYLHCKMQSRIRKAGVRQGLGENKLGLLSMTMPIRVTL